MKRFLKILAVMLFLPGIAFAQFTTVTASNIQDVSGSKLSSGQFCVDATLAVNASNDTTASEISFQAGGGGQVIRGPICTSVTNGAIGTFQVPNSGDTLPPNVPYHLYVLSVAGGGKHLLDYYQVSITGSTWNFDTYNPNLSISAPASPASVPQVLTLANSSTGTTNNTLTKLTGAPSTAIIAATSDTGGVVGITLTGGGTTGNATVAFSGSVPCIFDGATTAGDYVQISSGTGGNCHDAGATYPTSGQVVGRVQSTNGSGGTYTIDLFPSEIRAATGGSGLGGSNIYTSGQTASTSDNDKLVIMNCSSACSYTLPATQPSTTFFTQVESVGSTLATIALGGSDTFNGGATAPVLTPYRILTVYANTSTSTDYRGDAPLAAGNGITITSSPNQTTLGGGIPITTVSGLSPYATKGKVVSVTDGISSTDCTTGGGSTPVTCLYSGSTWGAVGISPGAINAIYLSTNCGSTANCYQVHADVQISFNATYTSGSKTVTFLASDPSWTSSMVGLPEFAAGNCPGTVSNCTIDIPQGTIASVVSAHSITVSIAAVHSSSGTANANNFASGHDDGTEIAAAYNAMFPNSFTSSQLQVQPQTTLYLPCGPMFTSVPPFAGSTNISNDGGIIWGCGSGSPIIMLPKMNCNISGTHAGCLFNDPTFNLENVGNNLPGWHLKDITFWGLGSDKPDGSATYNNPAYGISTTFSDTLDNVWVIGWVWNNTNPVIAIFNGAYAVSSGSDAAGTIGCEGGGTAATIAMYVGGSCSGGSPSGSGTAMSIVASGTNASSALETYGVYFNAPTTICSSNTTNTIWIDYGSHVYGHFTSSGTGCVSYLHGTILDQAGGGSSALTISNGIVHLDAINFEASGGPIDQTGGTIYDDCGNGVIPGTAPVITKLFGDCSVTGVADATGDHVLTSGWGTASVSAVTGSVKDVHFTISVTGGSPGASPVLTDTFATPFWGPPSDGCSLVQVLGNTGDISAPVASGLTRTGVTWTFTGTAVSGHSYTFWRHCANP
jgi:hypothetical protein